MPLDFLILFENILGSSAIKMILFYMLAMKQNMKHSMNRFMFLLTLLRLMMKDFWDMDSQETLRLFLQRIYHHFCST